MNLYRAFLSNHVFANLTFVLVILVGIAAFLSMPRAKDVEVNFNWINILTVLPGASAEDIEERITDPLENAIRKRVSDVRFVTSDSRAGASNLLVRFHQIEPLLNVFDHGNALKGETDLAPQAIRIESGL